MARTKTTAEFNTFVKGLVTEASPLNSVPSSSLDEQNFILNRNGSRQRRRGMDFENGFSKITTNVVAPASGEAAFSSFDWTNAGGDADKMISVIQVGNEIRFFDLDTTPISSSLIHTKTYSTVSVDTVFSYAVVDGLLVVATGLKEFSVFEFDGTSTVTETTDILYIRDLFGVDDGLRSLSNIENRPTSLTDTHLYNLRNQTWALPRVDGNNETVQDPITSFYAQGSSYPSNSDSVTPYLHADPNDGDNRTIERFFSEELFKNPPGSTASAIGYFIIDAMERGASRITEEAALRARHSLNFSVTTLPEDKTPGGPSVVTEFAGRVWFGGFSASLENGDDKSPRMSSYLLFSRFVQDSSDINKCYQGGDPTTAVNPDLIDTDGGFIRIDGAYGIKKLVNVGQHLLVIATNGVWRVFGGNDSGFNSTNYVVSKITSNGCRGTGSIVELENTVAYWGDDGIYSVAPNEFGDWAATNITQSTIQSLFDEINIEDKALVQGLYDKFERKIRWVYKNRLSQTDETEELVFDLNLKAFYKNVIKQLSVASIPRVVSLFKQQPYQLTTGTDNIVAASDNVIAGTDNVVEDINDRVTVTRQLGYVIITDLSPTIKFTFGVYRNNNFKDYFSSNSVGVDAAAFLVTAYVSGDDYQRDKQVPYLSCHFKRTEDGFEDVGGGDIQATNQSSCKVQARWNWADSATSGRWGEEFQAYRYRRHYIPADASDPFDYGFEVISSKSKLRGKGKVLSLKFSTEPDKDLHLYGWSMLIGITGNV